MIYGFTGDKIVPLERCANKFIGLCPYHKEDTPSFIVNAGEYYCFGCKASGQIEVLETVADTKKLQRP